MRWIGPSVMAFGLCWATMAGCGDDAPCEGTACDDGSAMRDGGGGGDDGGADDGGAHDDGAHPDGTGPIDTGPATDPPRATIAIRPPRIARGDGHTTVVTLDGSGSTGGGLAFEWTVPDGVFVDGTTPNDPIARVTLPGTADHEVQLRVANALGSDVAIASVETNRAPTAVIADPMPVVAGTAVTFDSSGSRDPDGDRLTPMWRVTSRPEGSTADFVDPSVAAPSLTPDRAGVYGIELVVHDGLDPSEPARATLIATAPERDPPIVTVTATPRRAPVGSDVRICASATDASTPVRIAVTVEGMALVLGGDGCGIARPTAVARYEVVATATDRWGNEARATTDFSGRAASDGGPPTVALTAPADGATIDRITDVTGTASDADLVAYRVEGRPVGGTEYLPLIEGRESVSAGLLGRLDPGRFAPGSYEVRLCAVDSYGTETCTPTRLWRLDAPPSPGYLRLVFRDASLELLGLPIVVHRVYDVRNLTSGDFGHGWRLELEGFGTFNAPPAPEEGWQDTGCTRFPFRASIVELSPHLFEVTVGARTHRYRMRAVGRACITGAAELDVVFDPLPGTTGTLVPTDVATSGLYLLRGTTDIVDADLGPWQPRAFRMTTGDGQIFDLRIGVGITSIADGRGNTIRFDGRRITHSSGEAVMLTRDGAGRITSMSLPGGATRSYAYDARGDLVASVDPRGARTTYLYDSHHRLIGIADPRGGVPGMMEYDAEGRVVAIVDPSGRRIQIARDEAARQEVITDRLGNTLIVYYDDRGNVIRQIDPLGNETRYGYDAAGNRTSITDPLGNVTRFEYDAAGRRTALIDPDGGRWEIGYDAAGNPISRRDPLGNVRRTEYSASGEVTAEVDATGARTTYAYTASGALASVDLPEGAQVRFTSDGAGRTTSMTDALGRTTMLSWGRDGELASTSLNTLIGGSPHTLRWSYDHNASGGIESITGPDGARSTLSVDASGQPIRAVGPDGTEQTIEYGPGGRVIAMTAPDGARTQIAYDAEDRPVAITLPSGGIVRRELDANGRVTRLELPGGRRFDYAYDAAGRLTQLADAMGRTTRYAYDRSGRIVAITRPDGTRVTYTRDAAGRIVERGDPATGTLSARYDAEGRVTGLSLPGGASSTIAHDAAGRPTRMTFSSGRTISYDYDAAGQLTSVTDAAGGVTRIGWGGAGDVERITTPSGLVRSYRHDLAGRLVERSGGWLERAETFTYDDAGNLRRHTDATGAHVDYTWDPAGRPLSRTASDGTSETRTYGDGGRLRSITTRLGTTSFVYDAAGDLARVTDASGRFVAYRRDPSGLPTEIATRAGTTRYEYDAAGRMIAVTDETGARTRWTYDAAGRPASATLGNGVTIRWERDAAGRLARVVHTAPDGRVLLDESYARDAAGRITRVASGGNTTEYGYDVEGRIAVERRPSGATLGYAYDADGNLVTRGATTLAYDAFGRLQSHGGTPVTWDAAGRMRSRVVDGVTETYTYDGFGRLVRIERAGGTPARIDLDYGEGDLLERVTVDGTARWLTWDRTGPVPLLVEESAADGTILVRYTWGVGGLVSYRTGGRTHYVHGDARRSIRLETDGSGAVTGRADYDAYGVPEGSTLAGAFGFAGEWRIPGTDLVYLRARIYEPRSGRFLTPDPAAPDLREPRGLNPYAYAAGDPVNGIDPLGRFSMTQLSAALQIMNVLATIVLSMWDSPEALVADAFGVRDILSGQARLRGATAQYGLAGIAGGGRGN
ncbi:MAG: RHS repeat-associated core domain-containing protein, partial [Myxococcales bacterium]|nr:RHS repeat-associated core domain-containing protein [Myxococcales bacterium]